MCVEIVLLYVACKNILKNVMLQWNNTMDYIQNINIKSISEIRALLNIGLSKIWKRHFSCKWYFVFYLSLKFVFVYVCNQYHQNCFLSYHTTAAMSALQNPFFTSILQYGESIFFTSAQKRKAFSVIVCEWEWVIRY